MATATATLKKMYIDGKWCEAADGKTVGVINPATEEVIADMAFGSRADVYLPEGKTALVSVGQRAIAGETVLADLTSIEAEREARLG